jgi:hypothetical protein
VGVSIAIAILRVCIETQSSAAPHRREDLIAFRIDNKKALTVIIK